MARPRKHGIEYFPFDVDFFEDDKIQFVNATVGAEAVLGYLRLLCAIYRVGLCWQFNEVQIVAYAATCAAKPPTVRRWLDKWLQAGLFHANVYNETGFLTSRAIQKRYLEIVRGRVELRVPEGVLLLTEQEVEKHTVIILRSNINIKVKGNYEFPHISAEETTEKLEETQEKPEEDPDPKKPCKDHPAIHLSKRDQELILKKYNENGLAQQEVIEGLDILEAYSKNNKRKFNKYECHRSVMNGWVLDAVIRKKKERLDLERSEAYHERATV